MNKPADTRYEIHDLLKNRWSPRAYSKRAIEPEKLQSLFEAARWSPSGGNMQPWAFIVVTQADQSTFQQLIETMRGRNPLWAKDAPVLVMAIAKLNLEKPEMDRSAYYALGQAVAHLSVQASALGLHTHQMGGFDGAKASQLAQIPEGYQLVTITAVGYFGAVDDLADEGLRTDELAARTRKPLRDFVFSEHWNQPLPILEDEAAPAPVSGD